jgi:hypothetical protein
MVDSLKVLDPNRPIREEPEVTHPIFLWRTAQASCDKSDLLG